MRRIHTVDARGLTCPQPVLETKNVLEKGEDDEFLVLVDNPSSRENVMRFARNQGCEVEVGEHDDGHFEIRIGPGGKPGAPEEQEEMVACAVPEPAGAGKTVVYVGSNCMGKGDDELGAKLMRGFLQTLIDMEPVPWRIIFINSGVKLVTTDEPATDAVKMLTERGSEVIACGTCLEHFGLEDELKIGRVTNMFEVIETMQEATKVISPG
jgi:selenium metabolism protein YedF